MSDSTVDSIRMKIAELEEAITTAHPRMPLLLKDIHGILKADPANVTLLSEEDIAILVTGLKRQTATEIATSALRKKPTLKGTTSDML